MLRYCRGGVCERHVCCFIGIVHFSHQYLIPQLQHDMDMWTSQDQLRAPLPLLPNLWMAGGSWFLTWDFNLKDYHKAESPFVHSLILLVSISGSYYRQKPFIYSLVSLVWFSQLSHNNYRQYMLWHFPLWKEHTFY